MDYITRTYHASNRTGGLGGNLLWKEMELQKVWSTRILDFELC